MLDALHNVVLVIIKVDFSEPSPSALDINCDGELEESEFIRGCLDDDDLINLLNAGGIDPQDDLE